MAAQSSTLKAIILLVLCTALNLAPLKSFAQCSVQSLSSKKPVVYVHTEESVYDEKTDGDGDYGNGAYIAHLFTTGVKAVSGEENISLFIRVIGLVTEDVVPRKLKINTYSGPSIVIAAESYNREFVESEYVYESAFPIALQSTLDRLLEARVKSIEIIDDRKNIRIKGRPYDKIISEQIRCVKNYM